MAEPKASTRRRRHVLDAPDDAERISLHGPPFADVLKALLEVDPKDLDDDQEPSGGTPPRD